MWLGKRLLLLLLLLGKWLPSRLLLLLGKWLPSRLLLLLGKWLAPRLLLWHRAAFLRPKSVHRLLHHLRRVGALRGAPKPTAIHGRCIGKNSLSNHS